MSIYIWNTKASDIFFGEQNALIAFNDIKIIELFNITYISHIMGRIEKELKEKLIRTNSLTILNLNKGNKGNTTRIKLDCSCMYNFLNNIFPNVSTFYFEENTEYYDIDEKKQVSILSDLFLPYFKSKLNKDTYNRFRIYFSNNIPEDFKKQIHELLAEARSKKKEEQRIQQSTKE